MDIHCTNVFERNATAWFNRSNGIRRILNEGGTSSSKTFSILQLLILIASSSKTPITVTVVSESLPHLKKGCIKDFFTILGESKDNNPRYNLTDDVYTWPNGSRLEFMGMDEIGKERGPRREILFCNETNNLKWEVVQGLDIRTSVIAFYDWNPTSEFFAHERWIGKPENAYIHSTYKDALSVLSPAVVEKIEENRLTDPNWWHVYGEGLIGKVEGLVYPYFEQVDTLLAGDIFYGLDFGYSNDPTVLTRNVIIPVPRIVGPVTEKPQDLLFSEELIYESGLTNDAIAHKLDEKGVRRGFDEIFADAAEPKSIEEIHRFGFNIKPCPKGADSVEFGHQKIRQYKQFWTKSSLNCIKEQRNFRYITDKDGKFTDKTAHQYSHGMDARRYAVLGKTGRAPIGIFYA